MQRLSWSYVLVNTNNTGLYQGGPHVCSVELESALHSGLCQARPSNIFTLTNHAARNGLHSGVTGLFGQSHSSFFSSKQA